VTTIPLRVEEDAAPYQLDEQAGFILRRAFQRHAAIFQGHIVDLTATQWAVLAKLSELEQASQNHLGRLTAMDAATMQGVVRRLMERDLVRRGESPLDRRRLVLRLTDSGRGLVEALTPHALAATRETLAPLAPKERDTFLRLLKKLV
jgi:DNA-binding MarR family transcriptional regulator